MPDFRFVSTTSTVQPSSGYACRIPQSFWSRHEQTIRQLHACGTTRDDILQTLVNNHDFQPSIGQLRDQMARWGLRSSRKSRVRSERDKEAVSSSSFSGSDEAQGHTPTLPTVYLVHHFSNVPDDSFASLWPQYDRGVLRCDIAIEMEVLADTLFLAGRYVAAYSLYSSVYNAVAVPHRPDGASLTTARFRALLGCLRSAANSEQRLHAIQIAETEMRNSVASTYCKMDDVDLHHAPSQLSEPLMIQFNDRESFRFAISARDDAPTVSDVVKRLHLDKSRVAVLQWCFNRLLSPDFVGTYNNQLERSGSGVACWTYGGSQSVIYWYLVSEALHDIEFSAPCFTILHTSGHTYTFSTCETFAIVASMVSAEPWLFSLDRLPLDGLQTWTESIMTDGNLFDTIFQQAIKVVMVPNFETRLNKTKSDALAAATGYPAYRMPPLYVLKSLATQMSRTQPALIPSSFEDDAMDLDIDCFASVPQLSFGDLAREYSSVIESYINENCAYGTSYQLREKPQKPAASRQSSASIVNKRIRPLGDWPQVPSVCDPTLTSSRRGSVGSSTSFRSFQSTHLRAKKMESNLPDLEVISRNTSRSSNYSRQFPLPIGV